LTSPHTANKTNTTQQKETARFAGKKGGEFAASPQGKKKKYKSAPTRDYPPSPPAADCRTVPKSAPSQPTD
jgi:hypothetical protein